jgi:hypothetical protein
MSKESRLRQLKFVNAIDRRQVKGTIFCTQTLRAGSGCGVVESWALIEAARRKWFKRLERELGARRWFALWRKEPHESGVAHLHVLIFFLDGPPHLVNEFRPWNDLAWAASVGDLSIRSTACRTELLRSWNGVSAYLCKYLAKEQDLQEVETGKVWDVVHREQVPLDFTCEVVKVEQAGIYRRACRKWHQRKVAGWQAKLPDKQGGGLRWFTVRPWARGSRVVSVADQVAHHRAAGVRVRRRRPRLSFTTEVRVWVESEESDGRTIVRAADLDRDGESLGRGAYVSTDEDSGNKGRVVERHTFFSGTYFLPADDAVRLLKWSRAECSRRMMLEWLPF